MNQELAKKLKEAGFPESTDSELSGRSTTIDDWTSPHLSELIEACKEMTGLWRNQGGWWVADTKNGADESSGRTPEEAVANLWLALHTPKPPMKNKRCKHEYGNPPDPRDSLDGKTRCTKCGKPMRPGYQEGLSGER